MRLQRILTRLGVVNQAVSLICLLESVTSSEFMSRERFIGTSNVQHATRAQPSNMYQTLFLAGTVTLIVLCLTLKFFAKRKVQNLDSKYVFITGCDSGFGRETAIRLDKMGVHVLAACLTKQEAQDLKSMSSGKLKTFQMDVTDSQQIKDVFEQVKNLLPSGQGKENSILGATISMNITGIILMITGIILVVIPLKEKKKARSFINYIFVHHP